MLGQAIVGRPGGLSLIRLSIHVKRLWFGYAAVITITRSNEAYRKNVIQTFIAGTS